MDSVPGLPTTNIFVQLARDLWFPEEEKLPYVPLIAFLRRLPLGSLSITRIRNPPALGSQKVVPLVEPESSN